MNTLRVIDTEVIKPLSAEEKAELLPRLQEQEKIASTALEGSVRLAVALETIRDQQLYRAVHDTWDAYFASVWKPRIEKSGRRYFDLWKRHLSLRDECRKAGLPGVSLPQGEKVSRAALKNITTEQAVELFKELHERGIEPTQSKVKNLRQAKGYEALKRTTKASEEVPAEPEDEAVTELQEYLQEFANAVMNWQAEASDWSESETDARVHKVVQSLAPQLETILELVMEGTEGRDLLTAYYSTDQQFKGTLNRGKAIPQQKAQKVARPAIRVEGPPAAAPAVELPKKRGQSKGSRRKTAGKNGDAPHDEKPAVVYNVTYKDENGQWSTVSYTTEYEAKKDYEELMTMGEKPVIIEDENGKKEILMKAPGAKVPEGD
jgi:hypothetical protein